MKRVKDTIKVMLGLCLLAFCLRLSFQFSSLELVYEILIYWNNKSRPTNGKERETSSSQHFFQLRPIEGGGEGEAINTRKSKQFDIPLA